MDIRVIYLTWYIRCTVVKRTAIDVPDLVRCEWCVTSCSEQCRRAVTGVAACGCHSVMAMPPHFTSLHLVVADDLLQAIHGHNSVLRLQC